MRAQDSGTAALKFRNQRHAAKDAIRIGCRVEEAGGAGRLGQQRQTAHCTRRMKVWKLFRLLGWVDDGDDCGVKHTVRAIPAGRINVSP